MPKVRTDGAERVVQTQRSTILTPEDVDALVAQMRRTYDRIRLVDDALNRYVSLTKERPEPDLSYFDSAHEAPTRLLVVWQEPADWRPVWSKLGPAAGSPSSWARLGNPPGTRLEVAMNRDIPVERGRSLIGRVGALYRTDDDEARAFVREAWKALRKVASDVAPRDKQWWGDVKARYPKDQLKATGIWVGFHALRRAEALRVPVLKIAWRPNDFPGAT